MENDKPQSGAPVVHPQIQMQADIARMRTEQEFRKLRDNESRRIDTTKPLPAPDKTRLLNQVVTNLAKSVVGTGGVKIRHFITSGLRKVVPRVGGELILIAAHSGKGKSTVVANICYSNWRQGLKTIVFSNEEPGPDVIARIAGIELGIGLGRIKDSKLSEAEAVRMAEVSKEVAEFVEVVDQETWGRADYLKSLDGFKHAWSTFDYTKYDAVVIDYYQNVTFDTAVPSKTVNDVQSGFADFLDTQKNLIPCPIFVMAQLKEHSDEEAEFENRLKGRKIIFDKCTFALELIPNKSNFTSKWVIRKDRSRGRDGVTISTGFDWVYNRYVDPDAGFIEKQMSWIRQRNERAARMHREDEDE
jgi:archaellum biogenesis ATPase FlaH